MGSKSITGFGTCTQLFINVCVIEAMRAMMLLVHKRENVRETCFLDYPCRAISCTQAHTCRDRYTPGEECAEIGEILDGMAEWQEGTTEQETGSRDMARKWQ